MNNKGRIIIGMMLIMLITLFYFTDDMVVYLGDHKNNSYGYDTYDMELGQVWFYAYRTEDPFNDYSSVSIDSIIAVSGKYVQFIDTETKEIDSRSKRGFLYDRQLMFHTGREGDRYLLNQNALNEAIGKSPHNQSGALRIKRNNQDK